MPTDSAAASSPPGDEGMSLLEVMTALFVISTVMAGVAPFLITSVALSSRQRGDQVAIQVAIDGLERARAIRANLLPKGRGELAAQNQWNAAPPKVDALLKHMQLAADVALPGSLDGAQAPLPTESVPVTINNIEYLQDFYLGRCWQSKAVAAPPPGGTPAESSCDKTASGVPFYRVVVGVRWKQAGCKEEYCAYAASILISDADDPLFDTVQPPPKVVDDPNLQVVYKDNNAGYQVSYQVKSTGGRLPLSWGYTGTLPPGLTFDPDSGLISGKPTTTGTYDQVKVKVTDKDGRSDDSLFKWLVVDDLVLTTPANQSTRNNVAVDLPLTATGGRTPLTWKASNLPAGLTINSATGRITGSTAMTGAQTYYPVVEVTDSGAPRTTSVSFTWYVGPVTTTTPLTLANFMPPPAQKGASVNYNLVAANIAKGGVPPYTWSAVNLPEDLKLDSATGVVDGSINYASRYIVTLTVTDKIGQQASTDVIVRVTTKKGSDLTVESPSGTPMTSPAGKAITAFDAEFDGTEGKSIVWTATGLPDGLKITTAGRISGTPTKPGTYRVTLKVTNHKDDAAYMVFDWTVT
ncbi:Ig domain-containing protein [Actinoplanes sp. NPDC051346]|uniref:Ig domain-containing protein n=1 Tax=Actinoplanes sp. NPDC051346 TaxID=3155048 RepID=UPI00343051AD